MGRGKREGGKRDRERCVCGAGSSIKALVTTGDEKTRERLKESQRERERERLEAYYAVNTIALQSDIVCETAP